ncbi:hypothetical protein BJK05_11350 [Pectobacterium polaris]|nr:hypothetical protein BJK05_11350 [Pectobacterium polaris]
MFFIYLLVSGMTFLLRMVQFTLQLAFKHHEFLIYFIKQLIIFQKTVFFLEQIYLFNTLIKLKKLDLLIMK